MSRYGFVMPDKRHLAEAISIEAIGGTDTPKEIPPASAERSQVLAPLAEVNAYMAGQMRPTPIYDRDALLAAASLTLVTSSRLFLQVSEMPTKTSLNPGRP